jgi:hypothetical protein
MTEITFISLGPDDYDRAKKVLNLAKHPGFVGRAGFVGREQYYRCATHGTCTIAVVDGKDVGVALIAKEKLQALSVIIKAQGMGIGAALVDRMKPRWVNCIGERVAWFEKRGYKTVGEPRVSHNGKHAQFLLERLSGDQIAAPIIPQDMVLETSVKTNMEPSVNGRHKPTVEEYTKRVEYAAKLIAVKRLSHAQVKRILCKKFSVHFNSALRYIVNAKKLLLTRTGKPKQDHLANAIAFYESIVGNKEATLDERMKAQGHLDDIFQLVPKPEKNLAGIGTMNITFVEHRIENQEQLNAFKQQIGSSTLPEATCLPSQ